MSFSVTQCSLWLGFPLGHTLQRRRPHDPEINLSEPLRDQLQSTLGDAYAIERELGGGGMAHVFVAEEKAFGRRIVVKVLPIETKAEVSVERFKREIKVAARLQHPHIVPVLSAGQIQGLPYYTMPFVKGESLRARLARSGELSVNEAVHYLRDVAAALAYAHSEGVVHRDIKPDNVIVSGGVAVVTDFGVSKAVDVAATEGNPTTGITSLGVALGTPAYMAPEQASADPRVDHRADIYSFGCLAYELLAGSSPFAGRPPQQMLAAHVTDAPEPILRRRPQIPPGLAALVMKCLEKRPGDRPQTADEIVATLDAISTPSGGMSPTSEKLAAVPRFRMSWIAAAVALVAVVSVGVFLWFRTAQTKPYTVGATTPIAVGPDLELQPAISPDGKVVAFTASTPKGTRIFIRQIDGGRATVLTDEIDGNYNFPEWSPDGSRISFSAAGAIYVIPALTGGTPKRIIEGGSTHTWSRDGAQIVYAKGDGLFAYQLSGGSQRKLRSGAMVHSPAVSPDGRLLAYAQGRYPTGQNLSANSVWIVPMSGGEPVRVSDSTHVNLCPVWAADGKSLLYVSNAGGTRDVFQQSISGDGRPRGKAEKITTSLGSYTISMSSNGSRMAYDVVHNYSNIFEIDIGSRPALISAGKQITREKQHIEALDLSHDGNWLVYDSDLAGNADIYKIRVGGGEPIQLTTNQANDFAPAWSPDDREIAFHSNRNGTRDILVVNSEGNDEQQVTSGPNEDYFPTWSPDSRRLAFGRENGGAYSILLVSRDASGKWSKPTVFAISDTLTNSEVRWSPDGSLISYVRTGGVSVIRSTGEASRPLATTSVLHGQPNADYWARDSKTLFVYVTDKGRGLIWAVPLDGGTPRVVLTDEPGAQFGRWDFATDGKRLYYTRAAWEADVWVMEIKHN